jgi:HK97 family phage portal protein
VEFLPALRGVSDGAESKALAVPTESKMLTLPGYSSTTVLSSGGYAGNGYHRADAWDMERVIAEGYERVVWVFRCVELISGHASRLPFQIGRNIGTDTEERLAAHPLYRVLNKQANPLERGRHFRKRLSAQLLLSKKGVFVEVQKSRAGTIVRLDLLDPGRVRIIEDEHGEYIKHYEYTRRDGQVREIDPAKVRWIREPHPTDPFSGTTPLEAGGMSVQLDFLSRLYNVSFIQNDSRPGGILGVDADTLDDQEMDRIERKFKPGAHHAGEMTVIGTGPGGMNYVDSTTKPRDMAYGEMAANAKNEVLSAFGIGESLLGNAAGRTYDNAESELYGFWTQVMPSHLELIAGAFEQDIDEEWDPFLDTSGIEVLELPRRRDREEALREFNSGLRSIDEYRPLAKLPKIGLAQTRALWISPAKAPVPTRPEDAAALGMEAPGAAAGAPPAGAPAAGDESAAAAVAAADGATGGAVPAGGTAADAVREANEATTTQDAPGDAAAAVAEASAMNPTTPPTGDAAEALEEARRSMEGKALDPSTPRTGPQTVEHDPGEQEAAAAELAVAAALTALLARQQGVTQAKLDSPKTRKGTKFWTADGPDDTRGGDAELDAAKVTDAAKWQQEVVDTLSPVLMPAASAAAASLLTTMAGAGVIATATDATEISALAAKIAVSPTLVAVAAAANAMSELVEDLTQVVRTEVAATDSTEVVKAKVREFFAKHGDEFARKIATTAAHSAVNGARDAAANAMVGMPGPDGEIPSVVATWQTQRDTHVRPAHAEAQGTSVLVGEPFDMDGHRVRFPQDPMAPPYLIFGCRCHLSYRVRGDGVFLLPPASEV